MPSQISTKFPKPTRVKLSPYKYGLKKREIYDKQDGLCAICGWFVSFYWFEIDHIRKRSLGGGDEDSNLRGLCPECHRTRHAESDQKIYSAKLNGKPGDTAA